MLRRSVLVALGLLLNVVFAGLMFAQRSDRIIITGVVTDPAGAAVPEAKVTVTDEATGVTSIVDTSGTGNYATPPLTLGTYTLKVEKDGFKAYVRSGIVTLGGQTYRQDAVLELGAMTQTVEVKASAEMINVSSADVSHTVNEKYYKDLPIVMGADIRLAEALLHVEPGYLPMQPNGDTMFRGTQFNSRINGGQTMSTESYFDGAAFGFAEGHQQTQESALPYEAVRELKVINNSYSAQYGHTSGGLIEYTTKSGTNDFHGSVYDYTANDALDARSFFLPSKNSVRQTNPGFSFGGPIRKDKTHFFTNYDFLRLRQGVLTGFTNTVASAAERSGNFSELLTSTVIGQDALGRDILSGAIYDPASTRNVTSGQVDPVTGITATATGPVRDAFAGNIIPANHPMRSTVAAQILPLAPNPDLPGVPINNLLGGTGDASAVFDITTWLVRIDHSFGPSLKSSTSFFLNNRPSQRHCGEIQQCNSANPPTESEKNDTFIGPGFFQHIKNRFIHQQFDWIIKPNLFNHTTLSFDRWYIGGHALNAGVGWNSKLGLQHQINTADGNNLLWPLFDDGAMPEFNFGGGVVPYNRFGLSWARGYDANNRWQFLDDITWIKGRHTIKAGFEYRYHQFPLNGWQQGGYMGVYSFNADATGGYDTSGVRPFATGDSMASFILGQVNNAGWNIPAYTMFLDKYWAPWVNDEFKVSDKLTVTFGIRFDYNQARYEKYDRYSTFDPTTPNPGAGNLPGAVLFAGTGTGRTGSRFFEDPQRTAWGPRFGATYRLSPKSVIRAGYGMYYSVLPFSQFMGRPQTGFSNNPAANNNFGGRFPAFHLDTGMTTANTPGGSVDAIGPVVTLPPFIDPTIDNNRDTVYVPSDSLTQPRYQNWSISYQRQINDNLLLDLAYVANRGTQLPANWQYAGLSANMNDPTILSDILPLLPSGSDLLDAAGQLTQDISNPINQSFAPIAAMPTFGGVHLPYSGFAGTAAQALRAYPQYRNILARSLPVGSSIYHSFQIKLEKRFSAGFQYRVAYTYSRLMNDGAESGQSGFGAAGNAWQGSGVQNPLSVHAGEYSRSLDDVPHTLVFAYTYELPFGPGKKFGGQTSGAAAKILGGWSFAAVQRYQSGRPLSITMDNRFGGALFNPSRRPNVGSGGQGNVGGNFDPATDRTVLTGGWSDPGNNSPFGDELRINPDIRTFKWFNEDFNLFKVTNVTERVAIRFEAMFGNAFNRTFFCNGNSNFSSPDFGRVFAACDTPRRIQFGLRVDF